MIDQAFFTAEAASRYIL